MTTVRTAEVEWSGDFLHGEGRLVSTTTGALPELGVTWKARTEDGQPLTSPEELIAAAHASCFAMQFTHDLIAAGGEPEGMHVSAAASASTPRSASRAPRCRRVSAPPLSSRERIGEIAEAAKQACPVSRALAGVEITLELGQPLPPGAARPRPVSSPPLAVRSSGAPCSARRRDGPARLPWARHGRT